jgi:hypothetical protein
MAADDVDPDLDALVAFACEATDRDCEEFLNGLAPGPFRMLVLLLLHHCRPGFAPGS